MAKYSIYKSAPSGYEKCEGIVQNVKFWMQLLFVDSLIDRHHIAQTRMRKKCKLGNVILRYAITWAYTGSGMTKKDLFCVQMISHCMGIM